MMNIVVQIEHRASSRRGKHEGESSIGLCDRLSRTRDNSQRQLPTDQDYAVPTREYQTDQSSLKTAPTAARSVLEKRRKQSQQQTHRLRWLTRSLHIRPMHSLSLDSPHKGSCGELGSMYRQTRRVLVRRYRASRRPCTGRIAADKPTWRGKSVSVSALAMMRLLRRPIGFGSPNPSTRIDLD
jgi:hypothetical protein